MKAVATAVLVIGAISMVIGIVLRLAVRQIALGLTPSSFLELSVACFLLAIAINTSK